MPRILDNISLDLVSALKNTLAGSCSADISVGYFNLRGWCFLDAQMENFPGGEGHCCRPIVGMQRSPQEELRRSLSLLKNGERLSNKEVNRLVRVATEEFREQLQIGAPTDADEKGLRRLSAQLRAKKLLVRLYLREPLHAKLYLIHRDDLPGQPGTLDLRSPEHRQGRDRAGSSLAIVHRDRLQHPAQDGRLALRKGRELARTRGHS